MRRFLFSLQLHGEFMIYDLMIYDLASSERIRVHGPDARPTLEAGAIHEYGPAEL